MTDIDVQPGVIHDGAGVIARWPGVVALIPADPGHQAAVESMFAELGTDPDPADVVRAIRELMIDEETITAAAYIMTATGGPMALAHGGTEVLVDDEVVLTGTDGPNERQITTGDHITLRRTTDDAASPGGPYDLRRGVVPGGGITLGKPGSSATNLGVLPPPDLSTASSPSLAAGPDPTTEAIQAPFRSVLLFGADAPVVEPRPPLAIVAPPPTAEPPQEPVAPVAPLSQHQFQAPPALPIEPAPAPAPPPAPALEPESDDVSVLGIVCSRGHFNNPAAAFCMVCGISMVHVTHNLVPGPRPTLGFVVFDDGSTFGLDRSYAIGREPGETGDPHTAPLAIQDNNDTLSRRHAEIRLIEWIVHIVDLGSTNGTFIWDLQYERWNQIAPNQPVPLTPGDTVALGRRTFVYESVSA